MTTLSGRKCVPCEGGMAPLPRDEAEKFLQQLSPEWKLTRNAAAIEREFRFVDFYRTMSFVNAVAHVANVEDHHPDLEVGYGRCHVLFTTHAARGLSENDFICAAKLELIPLT